jgi:hypothetical protein
MPRTDGNATHVPVVRDGIMALQELAAALKLAPRSGPAQPGAARRWRCPGALVAGESG